MADDSALSPARRNFNLQAFRELKQEDFDSSQESELLNNPVNIAVINKDTYSKQSLDDGVIKRIYKSPFHDNQNSTRTLPRRPSEQQNNERYFYPSNTIVASNGHVYHVEPFMLPPPQQISQVIRDLTDRTEKSKTDFFSDNRSSKGSLSRRNNEFKFDSSTSLLRPASMRSSSSRSLDDGSYKSSYLRATQSSRDVLHMVEDENDDDVDEDKIRRPGERRASDSQLYANKRLFNPNILNNNIPFSPRPLSVKKRDSAHNSPAAGHEEEFKGFSIVRYMASEILGMVESNNYDSDAVVKIQNFLGVPFMVERLIFLGLFACLDSFLYVMTYLPIRVVIACSTIVWNALSLLPVHLNLKSKSGAGSGIMRTQQYDLIRGLLFLIGCFALRLLNMSRVYHYIRGQTMIKLYVLTAILEVFDRLLGSFGQDAFESLHLQAKNHPFQWNNIVTFLVVSVYVIIHSTIYFIYVATLLVAINSAESALITVLFLNNFAEIKSFVFKKFDRISLFQLACGDITERFQLILFLVLIMMVSLAQAGSAWKASLYNQAVIFVVMLSGEAVADWIKHAFIAKFNSLEPHVYADMERVLRKDIINLFNEDEDTDKVVFDHNYAITRRVGLSQIPLGCVSIRYILLALDAPYVKAYFDSFSRQQLLFWGGVLFCGLLAFKVCLGVALILVAGWVHNRELQDDAANMEKVSSAELKEHRELMEQLFNIQRYTLYRGRIVA